MTKGYSNLEFEGEDQDQVKTELCHIREGNPLKRVTDTSELRGDQGVKGR